MKITILTDNKDSWFVSYGYELKNQLISKGHEVTYVFCKEDILQGDLCFLLSCVYIVEQDYLKRNLNNIVVHASDLPKGKGFSPLQWQVMEGASSIILTLFEVVKEVDAGPYYLKRSLDLTGTELYDELRCKLATKIIEMCNEYVDNIKTLPSIPQTGSETFYRRRSVDDDMLDIEKSILQQINHLRIADNENFPLWFIYKGEKFFLKIYKA